MLKQMKAAGWLVLFALNLYAALWRNVPEAWTWSRWPRPLILAVVAAAAFGLVRLRESLSARALKVLCVLNALALPFFGLWAFIDWGRPVVLPNQQAYFASSMDAVFAEIRLAYTQSRSILQGKDRVLCVIGTPHEAWARAMQAASSSGGGASRCDPASPPAWERGPCEERGQKASSLCFSCRQGSSGDVYQHFLVLSADARQLAYFSGIGRLFDAAAKNAELLKKDAAGFSYRYPPAGAELRPADAAAFALFSGTSPVQGALAKALPAAVEECLQKMDPACAAAMAQQEDSRRILESKLSSTIYWERENAAIALAKRSHPQALRVLIDSFKKPQVDPMDRIVQLAEAASLYREEAGPAVVLLIQLEDKYGRTGMDVRPFSVQLIGPLLRIGTDEAFERVGKSADGPMRLDAAEEIRKTLEGMDLPPARAGFYLKQWLQRQQAQSRSGAWPLVYALKRLEGERALEPFLPWLRRMAEADKASDAWDELLRESVRSE